MLRIRGTGSYFFHFDAHPDPTFHSDADADPDPTFQTVADPITNFFPRFGPSNALK